MERKLMMKARPGVSLLDVALSTVVAVITTLVASQFFTNVYQQIDPHAQEAGLRKYLLAESILRAEAEGLRAQKDLGAGNLAVNYDNVLEKGERVQFWLDFRKQPGSEVTDENERFKNTLYFPVMRGNTPGNENPLTIGFADEIRNIGKQFSPNRDTDYDPIDFDKIQLIEWHLRLRPVDGSGNVILGSNPVMSLTLSTLRSEDKPDEKIGL